MWNLFVFMKHSLWISKKLNSYKFQLLNLDHPDINAIIIREIESGIDVYYDRRWELTEDFSCFLIDQQKWVKNRKVLVLGGGIGMETLIIGRLCSKMYINDLAQTALELCSLQLRENGLNNFKLFQGHYEFLNFPPVDIVVGCFLVYNPQTAKAMKRFLDNCSIPVLLINEPLYAFQRLIKTTKKKIYYLQHKNPVPCILFE